MTSQYHLITEFANFHTSRISKSKWVQERDNKLGDKLNVFGQIDIFASVEISITKSIIPVTDSFEYKLIHHKEKSISSIKKSTNFTNPLASSIESGN